MVLGNTANIFTYTYALSIIIVRVYIIYYSNGIQC